MNTHRKQRDIHGFLFKTAAILLMLVLVSTSLVTGRYARYTTTAESSDSARVAKFEVVGSGAGEVDVNCTATGSNQYIVTVENKSEVAVSYEIAVAFTEEVADDLDLKLYPGTDTTRDALTSEWSADNTMISFKTNGKLDPNAESVSHALAFAVKDWSFVTAANGTDADTDTDTGVSSKTLPFAIHITATQID